MADVPNYGLLTTMANGIKEGLTAYQTTQNMKRQNDMMNLAYGVQNGPNGLEYTPEKQAEITANRQFQTQQRQHQLDELDPNSQSSKNIGLLYKSAGLNIPQKPDGSGYSAAELKEAEPLYEKQMQMKYMAQALGNKNERADDKDWEGFADKLSNPSSRSQLGKYQGNIDNAGAIQKMISTIGVNPGEAPPENESDQERVARLNKATPQQAGEMVSALDKLISGGNTSVYGKEHLMPNTFSQTIANAQQYATGKPVEGGIGPILNNFAHTIDRESDYYKDQRDKHVKSFTAGYSHLQKKDPDRWDSILGDSLSSNNQSSGSGLLKAAEPTTAPKDDSGGGGLLSRITDFFKPHPDDSKAVQWALANPKDPRAADILKANGTSIGQK